MSCACYDDGVINVCAYCIHKDKCPTRTRTSACSCYDDRSRTVMTTRTVMMTTRTRTSTSHCSCYDDGVINLCSACRKKGAKK